MKAYQDEVTGKWKWGANGKYIHETKGEAKKHGLNQLTEALRRIQKRLGKAIHNHGK